MQLDKDLLGEAASDILFDASLALITKNKNVRLKDKPEFLEYARRNRWSDRMNRPKPLPWRMDVFDFVRIVYDSWIGKGLLQSDLKVADPGLYAEFQKKLSALRRDKKVVPDWIDRELPKERSQEALKHEVPDEHEREKISHFREIMRARVAASRAKRQEPSPS